MSQEYVSKAGTISHESVMLTLLKRFDGLQENREFGSRLWAGKPNMRALRGRSITRDFGVDGTRPGVDASGERLGVGEALVA
jgi:hypothetical protein